MPDPTQRPPRRPPKEPLIKIPESEIRVPPPEQLPPKPDEKPEIAEHAFDPDLKMMATVHRVDDGYLTAVKGAPEAILAHAGKLRSLPSRPRPSTERSLRRIEARYRV